MAVSTSSPPKVTFSPLELILLAASAGGSVCGFYAAYTYWWIVSQVYPPYLTYSMLVGGAVVPLTGLEVSRTLHRKWTISELNAQSQIRRSRLYVLVGTVELSWMIACILLLMGQDPLHGGTVAFLVAMALVVAYIVTVRLGLKYKARLRKRSEASTATTAS